MIRCIAVDDEPLALRQIEAYISKVPYLDKVALCSSASEATKLLQNESVDLMFVDINMPDISGMDFVKSLDNPPMVIFTTAYSEYAVEGFKVDAVDYLLKPFGFEDFQKSAAKAMTAVNQMVFAWISSNSVATSRQPGAFSGIPGKWFDRDE